jgi:hypothetical protein
VSHRREWIRHADYPYTATDGEPVIIHRVSIERLGLVRALTPHGYQYQHGWVRESDGRSFDLFVRREYPGDGSG